MVTNVKYLLTWENKDNIHKRLDPTVLACASQGNSDSETNIQTIPYIATQYGSGETTNVDKVFKKTYKVKKVNCTIVQALRLCTGCMVHRGSRGIALPFHGHDNRRCEGSASRPGRSLLPGRPGTHCTGGWVTPRAGLDRCGKSPPPPHRDSIPGPSSP